MGIFFAAVSIKILGVIAAARHFPGGFDWQYRVMSSLASQVDNPEGYWIFCVALSVSFGLLFCLAGQVTPLRGYAWQVTLRVSIISFRIGCLCGLVVGLERGVFHNISSILYKSHEVVAFIAFFGVFLGVLGFCTCQFAKEFKKRWFGAPSIALVLVCLPFFGAAISQLAIYIHYRHYGWVSPYWRELGRPVYISFAFWQWLASFGAFLSMGTLCWLSDGNSKKSES
jgi:thiamine transporter ThiT